MILRYQHSTTKKKGLFGLYWLLKPFFNKFSYDVFHLAVRFDTGNLKLLMKLLIDPAHDDFLVFRHGDKMNIQNI